TGAHDAVCNKPETSTFQTIGEEEAKPTQTMDQITARLNTYRRDVLQRGGMMPAKGLGIAAKWSKFLARKIKEKSILEYSILLKELDEVLAKGQDKGVVAFIEKEIAS